MLDAEHWLFSSCQHTSVLPFPLLKARVFYNIATTHLRVGFIQKQIWLLIFSPYFDIYPRSHLIKKTCAEIQLA